MQNEEKVSRHIDNVIDSVSEVHDFLCANEEYGDDWGIQLGHLDEIIDWLYEIKENKQSFDFLVHYAEQEVD